MWSERDTDRERSTEEHLRRIRSGAPPAERPRGYWIFFSIVMVLLALVVLLLIFL